MGRRTFGEAIPPSPREDLLMSEAPLQLSGKAVVSGGGRWVREYDLEETIDSSITLLVAVVVVVLLHLVAYTCCVGYSSYNYVGAVVGAVVAELAGD